MKILSYISVLILFILGSCQTQDNNIFKSPNRLFEGKLNNVNDTLYVDLKYNGNNIINSSPILLYYNDELIRWNICSHSSKSAYDSIALPTGEYKYVNLCSFQKNFILKGKTDKTDDIDAIFQIRMFDKAFVYRFLIENDETECIITEKSEIRFTDDKSIFYIPNGEKEPIGNIRMENIKEKKYTTPIIIEGKNYFVSFHEANLHNYPMLNVSFAPDKNAMIIESGNAILSGKAELPWRVVFYGDNMADLHDSKHVYPILNKPSEGDYSWVSPGISTWDWRVKGTTFDGFTYGMNDVSLKRYIDFAHKSGFKYFMLDAEWYDKNPLVSVDGLNIKDVIKYGNDKGIGIILYYDLGYVSKNNPEVDFERIASVYSSWGAKGIKYGFLGGKGTKYTPQAKTVRTEELIRIAARHKLLIDFHDHPIPFSGLERTYPNYINREYCHAQLDCRLSFAPSEFVRIACVNMLAGPIDQTNGTYALNEMKSRSKGPRNEYNSTVASETARFFITHTGHLSVLLDAPEAYIEKSDLFEFIKSLPSRWDETKYLEMDFNSHVSIARRNGSSWYVGTVFNEKGGEHNLKLDFIGDGDYTLTLFSDSDDTHYINNKESYSISKYKVHKNDVLNIKVAPGGGYSALIRRN